MDGIWDFGGNPILWTAAHIQQHHANINRINKSVHVLIGLNEIGVRWLAKEEQDKAEIACINITIASDIGKAIANGVAAVFK